MKKRFETTRERILETSPTAYKGCSLMACVEVVPRVKLTGLQNTATLGVIGFRSPKKGPRTWLRCGGLLNINGVIRIQRSIYLPSTAAICVQRIIAFRSPTVKTTTPHDSQAWIAITADTKYAQQPQCSNFESTDQYAKRRRQSRKFGARSIGLMCSRRCLRGKILNIDQITINLTSNLSLFFSGTCDH